MTDLIWLLGQLVDVKGKILIPGVMDDVQAMTDAEKALYENVEFDLAAFKRDAGVKGLIHPDCEVWQCIFIFFGF